MYEFRDVTEVSEGTILPSEALKINGEYIENIIGGYRTLNVSGREALSPDVVSEEVGASDGSRLKSKRYPERIIIVKYQLITKTPEEFREAYNKLAYILDVENAELIFNDEPDKFFIGTPCIIGSVDPGKNAVTGEFEILCTDPFKYSVIEYEATADLAESSILIDYNGTYRAFPTLQANFYEENDNENTALTGAGDCGYVAFFTEDEKIVQIGNPDEVDTETAYDKSQTLFAPVFTNANSWDVGKSSWSLNNGVVSSSAVEQAGNVGIGIEQYAQAASAAKTSGTLLTAKSDIEAPTVNYKITAKTSERSASSVKVQIAITSSLGRDSSYFGRGFGLLGSVYIGGSWRNITLKTTSDYWRGKTGHTVNLTVTVSGLSASTTALSGIKFKVSRSDSVGGKTGVLEETKCNDLKISTYTSATPEKYYLYSADYGTGTQWHGATITRAIPKDATGDIGAKNFKVSYAHRLSIGSGSGATNQLGMLQVILSDSNGNVVVGAAVVKSKAGKKATIKYYVNNTVAWTVDVDASYTNKCFQPSVASDISKSGDTITFNVGGVKKKFIDSNIKDTVVTKVTVVFSKYGTKTALTHNGLCWLKFVKNNCDTQANIPNKFGANDVLKADCRNGEITLNGVLSPELGALGNDWEEFYLTPGLNQIGYAFSDWVDAEYAPEFKVLYREVFL